MFSDQGGSATLNVNCSMLSGELDVLPPALQSTSVVTLFAVDADIGHAGARIHLVGGQGVCHPPFCKVGWLLVLLSMLPGVAVVAWSAAG